MWVNPSCPVCRATNWVYIGEEVGPVLEIEVTICWKCRMKFWVDDLLPEFSEYDLDTAPCAEGQSNPELSLESLIRLYKMAYNSHSSDLCNELEKMIPATYHLYRYQEWWPQLPYRAFRDV